MIPLNNIIFIQTKIGGIAFNETLGKNFGRDKVIVIIFNGLKNCPAYPRCLRNFLEGDILRFPIIF